MRRRLPTDPLARLTAPIRRHAGAITVGLAVVLLVALVLFGEVGPTVAALAAFPWPLFALVAALTLTSYGIRYVRWSYYLDRLDLDIPVGVRMRTFLSGLTMAVSPGKIGEVWKAWLVEKEEGIPARRTIPAVVLERVTDVAGLALIAVAGALLIGDLPLPWWVLPAILVGIVGVTLLLRWRRAWSSVIDRVAGIPLLGRVAEPLDALHTGSRSLTGPRPMVVSVGLGAVAWGLEAVALWVVLAGFGVGHLGLAAAFLVFGVGSIVGAVSMLPGGLGAAEAGMTGLLVAFGVGPATAVAATLVVRAGTLWLGVLLGGAVHLAGRALADERGVGAPAPGDGPS